MLVSDVDDAWAWWRKSFRERHPLVMHPLQKGGVTEVDAPWGDDRQCRQYRVASRYSRFAQRLERRSRWWWQGVQLWLVFRP